MIEFIDLKAQQSLCRRSPFEATPLRVTAEKRQIKYTLPQDSL